MRLIDADAMIEDAFTIADETSIIIKDACDAQPTVDAVPVIRCKDCKHNVANKKIDPLDITDYSGEDIVCDYFMTDGLDSKDFCSHAERIDQ